LPVLTRTSLYEEITGFIALGSLIVIALLGAWLWIESALLKRRMPKVVHTTHALLTIVFFVVLLLHI